MVTTDDYHVVMKNAGIADLKARLSEHLRSVRKGRTLTVLDRGTPVARIVPCASEVLDVRRAARRPRALVLPPAPAKRTDSVAVLRGSRRSPSGRAGLARRHRSDSVAPRCPQS